MLSPAPFFGHSADAQRLQQRIRRLSPYFRIVLLRGEQGSGRKTVARTLHALGRGATTPFIVCSFVQGSQTCTWDTALLHHARTGTLLLHCLEQMPLHSQSMLLNSLIERDAESAGSAEQRRANARIIATTSEDLRTLTERGHFNSNLYLRLSAVEIEIPSLRERPQDIATLARVMLQTLSPSSIFEQKTLDLFETLPWPGNLTQLHNTVQQALLNSAHLPIAPEHLPQTLHAPPIATPPATHTASSLDTAIRSHVLSVLAHCHGNKLRAAQLLGISRSTLYRMLEHS